MKSMTYQELVECIEILRGELANHKLSEILGWSYNTIRAIDWTNKSSISMTSPYKQCCYIASLGLQTPTNNKNIPLDKEKWEQFCDLSERIFSYYPLNYFNAEDLSKITEERHKQVGIVMASFMQSMGAGESVTVEQKIEEIGSLFSPYDAEIEKQAGISATEIIQICQFILQLLNDRISNGPLAIAEKFAQVEEALAMGKNPKDIIEEARKSGATRNLMRMNKVSRQELEEQFPSHKVESFLKIFCLHRATTPLETLYPLELYPLEKTPLVETDSEDYFLITGNMLTVSIYFNLDAILANLIPDRYYKSKSRLLELETFRCFKEILSTDDIWESVCENELGQNEHDILLSYNGTWIIIECKDKPIRKYFRDVDKAFPRIRDDFAASIQEGYDQAKNLYELIINQPSTSIFKKDGTLLFEIPIQKPENVFCLCVTRASEGLLASNPSMLITKNETDPPIFSINLYDLNQIADFKDDIEVTPDVFFSYIKARLSLTKEIMNDDELDLFGYYIKHGSFEKLKSIGNIYLPVPPSYSSIFDDAYLARKD